MSGINNDDDSLDWLLHDMIDQGKINAGDAVKILRRVEKKKLITDIAEFLFYNYDMAAKMASPAEVARKINNMRQALYYTCGDNLPTIRQASILVCRYRHYCEVLQPGWDITREALQHYRAMENAIMRIPEPVINANVAANKHAQRMVLLLQALFVFDKMPTEEFVIRTRGIEPEAINNLISGLSALALLMTGELDQYGAQLTQLLVNLQFLANE